MSHLSRMYPRNPQEKHRVASVLELFFDLVFVIAVSTLATNAHHLIEAGLTADSTQHSAHSLPQIGVTITTIGMYALIFEFIWWAWMNFTWFASSYDTDDWLYRINTFLQMIGVLVLTAGIEPMMHNADYRLAACGYVVMRLSMVSQWLRAWKSTDATALGTDAKPTANNAGTVTQRHHINTPAAIRSKQAAHTYAVGISILQVAWVLWAFVVPSSLWSSLMLAALVVGELAVCYFAERRGPTLWHPHHITERFGLFTIILLGESLLSSTSALISVLHESHNLWQTLSLFTLFLCSFVIIACLWWVYFWPTHHAVLNSFHRIMKYGYLHYVIFAAAGFLSVGVETIVSTLEHTHVTYFLGEIAAAQSLRTPIVMLYVPVAIFLAGVWWLISKAQAPQQLRTYITVCFIVLVFAIGIAAATGLFALPVPVIIAMVVGFVHWQPAE